MFKLHNVFATIDNNSLNVATILSIANKSQAYPTPGSNSFCCSGIICTTLSPHRLAKSMGLIQHRRRCVTFTMFSNVPVTQPIHNMITRSHRVQSVSDTAQISRIKDIFIIFPIGSWCHNWPLKQRSF